MKALKTIFFCGHESPYGFAHLEPVLDEFNVLSVVIATEERWALFRRKLSGESSLGGEKRKRLRERLRASLQKMASIGRRRASPEAVLSLEQICAHKKVPLVCVFDVNEEGFIEKMKAFQPDLLLSAAFPQIFPKALLSVAKRGAVNFHPSLLPRFRGAHPHFWSIAKGEKSGGVTAHFMTERIDDGDILAQIEFPIEDYYYEDLYKRIMKETPALVKQVRLFFEEGRQAVKQDPEKATSYRNDRQIHWRIFWSLMAGREIHNLIRTGHAFCFFRNRKIHLKRADLEKENRNMTNQVRAEAGTIVDLNGGKMVVAAQDGFLAIHILSEGGKDFIAPEWVLRNQPFVGEKFT